MAGGRWSCSAKLWQWEANLWHQLLHQNNRRQAVSVNNIAVKQCGWVHASEERVDSCECAARRGRRIAVVGMQKDCRSCGQLDSREVKMQEDGLSPREMGRDAMMDPGRLDGNRQGERVVVWRAGRAQLPWQCHAPKKHILGLVGSTAWMRLSGVLLFWALAAVVEGVPAFAGQGAAGAELGALCLLRIRGPGHLHGKEDSARAV